jgi:hypothetical protein
MRGDRVIVGRMDEPRCREVVDRLSEFLDGELDRSAAESVALHLEACASCAHRPRARRDDPGAPSAARALWPAARPAPVNALSRARG